MKSTVEKIETEIEKLDDEGLRAFRDWFNEFDGERRDRRIEGDIATGRLDAIARDALATHRAGKTKER